MEQLKEVLRGKDKAAMWKLLNDLKLSPSDKPYYPAGSDRKYDIFGGWRGDRSTICCFVDQRKLAHAIGAMAFDSFEKFQDFESKLKEREKTGADKEIGMDHFQGLHEGLG